MLDFMKVSTKRAQKGTVVEIYPKFVMAKSNDLMIRGGDFYAIWDKEQNIWSTDINDSYRLIDRELDIYAEEERKKHPEEVYRVLYLWDTDTGMVDKWHKYCRVQLSDSYHMLDERVIFANTKITKRDYASKMLSYPLEKGKFPAYDKLIGTLYSKEERHKIEWAIGAIVSGDSTKIQKFLVLYGAAGTGKSTILNIIQQLFEGYYSVFDAKALGSSNSSFALEAFTTNPLVAIQHDGDLSRIEDNTRLNSLVSHELMTVNEKFKSQYSTRFKAFLFMGTNKPVKITDGRSGLLRRLIDVTPSGNKLPVREYNTAMKQIPFELGAIAEHCLEVYEENPGCYDDYIPTSMLGASNDFYNYVIDNYHIFLRDDGTSLKAAWGLYNEYCEEAHVQFPLSQRLFKEELKNYFWDFNDRFSLEDGSRVRSYYTGFRTDKFIDESKKKDKGSSVTIDFKEQESIFDKICSGCQAQYGNDEEKPTRAWDKVDSILSDLDTSRVHYVRVPENHIVIDFDIKDKDGNKSYELNLEEASKWPPTYAELSKSGGGIHLHYIYTGDDLDDISTRYDTDIEIKKFTGKSSLRRRLTKCNDIPIATLNSGLPKKKGGKKVVDFKGIKSEAKLEEMIEKNLNKEYHDSTAQSINFIHHILEGAYNSELSYDVSKYQQKIVKFANQSSNQAVNCLKTVAKMKFRSKDKEIEDLIAPGPVVIFDIEVLPNLLLLCWKELDKEPVHRIFNPEPAYVEWFFTNKIIGFNNRRYDNHILTARAKGKSIEKCYEISSRIINKDTTAFEKQGWNASYTDCYDFASAGNKMSLKKFEIKLGLPHKEFEMAWDQPLDEKYWDILADYCENDVRATEAVFHYLEPDWEARKIVATIAGMTPNDTTNSLSTRIIFGKEKNPQKAFFYRNLAEPVFSIEPEMLEFLRIAKPNMMAVRHGELGSILPYFPGYTHDNGKSIYRGEEVGEGGYVYAEPGIYSNVALIDVASMHPNSVMDEYLFGKYTYGFRDLVGARIAIKHFKMGENHTELKKMMNGALAGCVDLLEKGEVKPKDVANALKTVINSVYGLTAASFDNPFNNSRNKDNIVAKRGALFMVDLKHFVQERGFTVAHIKTDSIKIPNATPEIIQEVLDFGERYGYTFEHEATYERMCLVNDAVYIAKYPDGKWTATGKQFQVPFIFKTLFSKEPLEFKDLCETMSVSTELYLDFNESLPEDEHDYQFVGKVGSFCPVVPGSGGGVLLRKGTDKDGNVKYSAATGSKGYRWVEAANIKGVQEDIVDMSYFNAMADTAIETINKYGDFEWFVSDEPYPND